VLCIVISLTAMCAASLSSRPHDPAPSRCHFYFLNSKERCLTLYLLKRRIVLLFFFSGEMYGKVFPMPTVKACRGSGGIAPLILNLNTIWGCVDLRTI